MKRKMGKASREGGVRIDNCHSILVQELPHPVEKLCHPPQAVLEGKLLFFGGHKWKLRLKDLTSVRLDDDNDQMIVATDKWQIKMKKAIRDNYTAATPNFEDQWEQFRQKLQRSFDRRNGIDHPRERKTFGSKKTLSKKSTPHNEMPWDDNRPTLVSTHKIRKTTGIVKSLDDSNSLDFIDSDDDHQKTVSDESDKESSGRRVAVGKRLTKLEKSGTLKECEETDDEDMFESGATFTTPAARRIVSPSTRSSSVQMVVDEESSPGGEENFETSEVGPSQRSIHDFFGAKSSATPKPAMSPIAPTTPPPSNRKARLDLTPSRRQSSSKYWNKPHVSATKTSGLFSLQSPTRPSIQEKRGEELFGSSAKRKIPLALQDPIEEDAASPQRKRVQRFRLLQKSTTRRMNFDIVPRDNEPSRPRFRGLENLGNTCYMNASIQMISSCRNFMESLAQQHSETTTLTKRLADLDQQLQVMNARAASPAAIKEAIDAKTDKFSGYEQRDAHEFLADLIDHIHEELDPPATHEPTSAQTEEQSTAEPPGAAKKRFPTDDFCTKVKATLRCTHCGYARDKEEMYRCLSIDIRFDKASQRASVEHCLAGFFEPEEREINCEKCEVGTHAKQTLQIVARPKYLLLHLKRFIFVEQPIVTAENNEPNSPSQPNQVEYVFKKSKTPVIVPPRLDLETFHASDSTGQEKTGGYQLKSLVHHIGRQASSGHYTAQAKRGDDWVTFDDRNSDYTTLDHVTSLSRASTAYLMLYELSPDGGATPKPLPQGLPQASTVKPRFEESI